MASRLTGAIAGMQTAPRLRFPLDYQDPQGDRVTLSMSKVRSRGESIGSLFVNPGGPGGSAFEYAKAADYIVS